MTSSPTPADGTSRDDGYLDPDILDDPPQFVRSEDGTVEDADIEEVDEDFLPPPRQRLTALTLVLIALLIAGLGFLAGALTQKHTGTSTQATRGGFGAAAAGGARNAERGAFGANGGFGGTTGGGTTGGGTTGGAAGAGGGAATSSDTPTVIGTIVSVNGDTAVVKNLAGKQITVHLSPDTKVSRAASTTDLQSGQTVTVVGSTGTDGSVSATTVTTK